MQTAEATLSSFLSENAGQILELAQREGFTFSARASARCVTVRCVLPDGRVRFVVFDDHRIENPHGDRPHVCNQWHKAVGDPISYTMGKEVHDKQLVTKVLRAASVMCLTQSAAYDDMKNAVFEN